LFEFNLSSISALPKLSDIDRQRFEADTIQENEET
ncbi:MAG: SMC-Scp complex subunit ScpB, partial [Spirochaetia bacterium]|nr:SMC-Scp complex subunit ScpB [Spirochaetia bacterium]